MSVHFAFPFTIDGSAAVVSQDSPAELTQNVTVLVLTEVGERLEVPEFGISDPTFRTELDIAAITEAAEMWDERAKVFINTDDIERMVRNVRLSVEEQ